METDEPNLSGPYCVGGSHSDGKTSKNTNHYLQQLLITFIFSFLAWPISYSFNNFLTTVPLEERLLWMALSRLVLLFVVLWVTLNILRTTEIMDHAWRLLGFFANIAFMLTLEHDQVLTGFMHFYDQFGDELLALNLGFLPVIIDSLLYLILVHRLSSGKSCSIAAIYSLIALGVNGALIFGGNMLDKLEMVLFIVVNLPYVILPVAIFYREWSHVPPTIKKKTK